MKKFMELWKRITRPGPGEFLDEQTRSIREIKRAHQEWEIAQKRIDEAVGKDQVDYAIFLLEASEKRYDMLLKAAKQNGLSALRHKPAVVRDAAEHALGKKIGDSHEG